MKLTKTLPVGSKIYFTSEGTRPFTVQAADKRYMVCTAPTKIGNIKTVHYTVVDINGMIRGTENLVLCFGAEKRDDCNEMLSRIARGETEISARNCISPLDVYFYKTKVRVPYKQISIKRAVNRLIKAIGVYGEREGKHVALCFGNGVILRMNGLMIAGGTDHCIKEIEQIEKQRK